jgi:hypothetical protein
MSDRAFRIAAVVLTVGIMGTAYLVGTLTIQNKIEKTKEVKEQDRISDCLWQKDGRDYTGYAWNILKDQPTEQIVKTTGATQAQVEDCI